MAEQQEMQAAIDAADAEQQEQPADADDAEAQPAPKKVKPGGCTEALPYNV